MNSKRLWKMNPLTSLPLPTKKFPAQTCMLTISSCVTIIFNLLLRYKQFQHQFLVDMYINIESKCLRYMSFNQSMQDIWLYTPLLSSRAKDISIAAPTCSSLLHATGVRLLSNSCLAKKPLRGSTSSLESRSHERSKI